jgi:protein associated with RNAse G/E
VEKRFKQTIHREYPTEGSAVKIEHVKLDGSVLHLGEAKLLDLNQEKCLIKLHRVFMKKGVYDGLETLKEPGDSAITIGKIGEWHLTTQYFSKDGQTKGRYINLNTPIELYPYGIRYVDLELDVCVWPDRSVKLLDEEKLEEAVMKGFITERLSQNIKAKAEAILEETKKGSENL